MLGTQMNIHKYLHPSCVVSGRTLLCCPFPTLGSQLEKELEYLAYTSPTSNSKIKTVFSQT